MSGSKDHVLIVGAGPNQVPAIQLAKGRGLRVTAVDMDPDAEGFGLVDEAGVVSTRDADGVVAYARRVHDRHPIAGVMTMASESATTVAAVAEALGLPGTSPRSARLATNKVERQQAFQEAGVPAPRFAEADDAEAAVEAAEDLGWPVVVKPADSAGSRGVRKVGSAEEMRDAVREIREVSTRAEFLIEQFLTGSEHSIEGLMVDERIHWTAFSDRNYNKKEIYPPYFLEDGDTLPTALSSTAEAAAREAADQAVHSLGITWGPVKGDILISGGKPYVLEMAARLSGDYFCYETAPLYNGVNLLAATLDLSLGLPVSPEALCPRFERGVALRYVWPQPGRVVQISGIDEARSLMGVRFVRFEPRWQHLKIGVEIPPPRSMGERVASVLASAENREAATALAERAVSTIRIETV